MSAEPTSFDPAVPPIEAPARVAPVPVSRPRQARRKGYGRWIGLGLLALVIVLIASTVRNGRGAFTYSKYVDEVIREPQRYVGTVLRVEGAVVAGSIVNPAGTNRFSFRLERNGQVMPVRYQGIVPDVFRDGITVTVRGRFQRDNSMDADEVVARCPSRYEMEQLRNRGEAMPNAHPNTPSAMPR